MNDMAGNQIPTMPETEEVTFIHLEFRYKSGATDAYSLVEGVDEEAVEGDYWMIFQKRPFESTTSINMNDIARWTKRKQIAQLSKRKPGQCKICGVKTPSTFEMCARHGGVSA